MRRAIFIAVSLAVVVAGVLAAQSVQQMPAQGYLPETITIRRSVADTALVCVERWESIRSAAKLVGKASDKNVTLAFVPASIVVDGRRGSRALVECRITTATGVVGVVKITLWAEDA